MTHGTVAERVFNLVLRLYPAEFRDRFGATRVDPLVALRTD